MAIDTETPRTRRAILAAAIGAGAAAMASALGRPLSASAANGDPVIIGATTDGTNITVVRNAAATALAGTSTTGVGIYARSQSLPGDQAFQGKVGLVAEGFHDATSIGVLARSTGTGVRGGSDGGTGLQGYSGAFGSEPAPPAKTGVYGYAIQDAGAVGVLGQSTVGRGIQGVATSGIGFRAAVTTGYGLHATATTGTAIVGWTDGPKVGTALRTIGRVRFDNSVGIATIAAGTNSVTVTPGIDLSATSAVVATLQGSAGGSTTVARCVVNAATDTFTIYLTGSATTAVKVAWHVFG